MCVQRLVRQSCCASINFLVLVISCSYGIGHRQGALEGECWKVSARDFSVLFWQLLVSLSFQNKKLKGKKRHFRQKGPFEQDLESMV